MMGSQFRVLKNRGKVHRLEGETPGAVIVTIHPSAVLRAPDRDARAANYKMLVEDLRLARRQIR